MGRATPKRDAAIKVLLVHHRWTDKRVAHFLGCSKTPVASARRFLEGAGLIPTVGRRIDRHGNQHGTPASLGELMDRFMSDVSRGSTDTGCWPWTAARNEHGYGRLKFRGEEQLAHRVSYELHESPIPDGLSVLHHCDNPACVNPDHLFLGSHEDNMADMRRKGRQAKGRTKWAAKLTPDDVRAMREMYPDRSTHELGALFGVAQTTAWDVVAGRTWRHVA